MRKKIRFFKQHTMETCGISCILMLLDFYRKVQYPTVKQERKLYGLYRSRAFKGVSAASAAVCLSRNGLSVRLIHSSENLLENRGQYFTQELFRDIKEEYQRTLHNYGERVKVQTGILLTGRDLKKFLEMGNQIMVQCIVPGDADGIHDHVLHWVLLHGVKENMFLVCDPLSSKIQLTEEALLEYMDTPLGQICIVVGQENVSGELTGV